MSAPDNENSLDRQIKLSDDCLRSATNSVPQARMVRAGTVVIVDACPDNAETLGMALEFLGYEVTVCVTGAKGLALLEQLRPDFGLLDIRLPDLSGEEVARRIKAAPWGANTVLIAVTGWQLGDDVAVTQDNPFHATFLKPCDLVKLHATLQDIMRSESY